MKFKSHVDFRGHVEGKIEYTEECDKYFAHITDGALTWMDSSMLRNIARELELVADKLDKLNEEVKA